MKNVLALLLIAVTSLCYAEEKTHPAQAMISDGSYHIMNCKMQRDIVKSTIEIARYNESKAGDVAIQEENLKSCYEDGRNAMKLKYAAALKSAGNKKTKQQAVKTYYLAWDVAFNGVIPKMDEVGMEYRQRQSSNAGKLDAATSAVKLEFNL